MPYYDYTKKEQKEVSKVSGVKLTPTTTRLENEKPKPIQPPVVQYVQAAPPKITPTTKVLLAQPAPPPPPPPVTTIITHLPPPRSNAGVNTDVISKSSLGTMVDKDLLRMQTRAVNTDLRWDQLELIRQPRKLNHFNEGFRSYYDEEADVLGVMCCICCATRWNRCDNMMKGCRNVVSCPVYCWIFFIIPFLFLICLAILLTGLTGGRVIG